MTPGTLVTLEVEKPVAGGRMLARHDGRVVLVWGAIPGERVRARIDRVAKQVAYGSTVDVLAPSTDRCDPGGDWRCGGRVYAHIREARQLDIKREVVADALRRIGRMASPPGAPVLGSPEAGYRMRARLHVQGTRVGFYREETHEICDALSTGQFLPGAEVVVRRLGAALAAGDVDGVTALEIAENLDGSERVCHVEVDGRAETEPLRTIAGEPEVTGVVVSTRDGFHLVAGSASVTDLLPLSDGASPRTVRLRRDPRAFFQGNRHLLLPLLRHVLAHVPAGPVIDLYAGVGLFGLSLAARDAAAPAGGHVTLVEGDPISGADLAGNAAPFGEAVSVYRVPVEAFVRSMFPAGDATVVVDPPRTGMSREVVEGLVSRGPSRMVYVSCDPATFARDLRLLLDGGYRLESLQAFDLFPTTAHVEVVAALTR